MPQNQEIAELIADVKEQVLYLQELGVESLSVDIPPVGSLNSVDSDKLIVDSSAAAAKPGAAMSNLKSPIARPAGRALGSRLAALPSLAKRASRPAEPRPAGNQEMSKEPAATPDASKLEKAESEALFGDIGPKLPDSGDTIESIRAEIGDCTRCSLHSGRTQVVHSTGNFNADLMFVGEAPGADEDEQGFPFVGRAGQLLTKIIESIGLRREDVFIGNINRCRPPGNRAPEPVETAACRPYLLREVAVVKPKVIVVLGATAAHNLLQVKTPISKLRGNFHDYFGVKVMPTFHPAYLLRDPHKKREVWEDMKKVRDFLQK